MKVSKIFGCVLSLHICIIAVLLVQSGCQTGQPPTQVHTQRGTQATSQATSRAPMPARTQLPSQEVAMRSNVDGARRVSEGMIPATRVGEGQGLDAAFNAGLENESFGLEPVDPLDPIDPLEPINSGQTVDVTGPGYQTYTVKKGDSLWGIAKRYDVSVNELYSANDLNKNSVIRVGQQIQIPVEGSTATISQVTPEVYQPSSYNQATTTYTVQRGDTLSRIANRYDTTVGAIKAANGKSSDIIRVGESLTVPAGASGSTPSASTPSSTTTTTTTATTSPSSTTGASGGATRTHTVKAGEFPGKIARQYGMTTSELLAINGITDPRKLRVGQDLKVNASGSATNVDSRVETVRSSAPSQPVSIAPPQASSRTQPVAIRVIEADPLVEGEFTQPELEPQPQPQPEDDVFNNAIEIPVIRLED